MELRRGSSGRSTIFWILFLLVLFLCLLQVSVYSGKLQTDLSKTDGDGRETTQTSTTSQVEEGERESEEKKMKRYLGGPGSYPPRCTSKCGHCSPCRPVHVPVPPGTPVTTEYYPEAWRCKCGHRLYMP